MNFDDNKLRIIENLIKLTRISTYKEVIYFIDHFIKGEFNEISELNNTFIADFFTIDKQKASKILHNLLNLNLVEKTGINSYKIISTAEFEKLTYRWMENSITNEMNNINQLFKKNYHLTFFENLNFIDAINHFSHEIATASLTSNFYLESNITEFLFFKEWQNLSKNQAKIIESSISKFVYNLWHNRYLNLENRLIKMNDSKTKTGKIFFIICPRTVNKIFFIPPLIKAFQKKKIKDFLVESYQDFKKAFERNEKFIKKNILVPIINIEYDKFNGPLYIIKPHIYQIFQEDSLSPEKVSFIYYYNDSIAELLINKFMNLFDSLFKKEIQLDKSLDAPKDLKSENLGSFLYNNSLKTLDKIIDQIKNF